MKSQPSSLFDPFQVVLYDDTGLPLAVSQEATYGTDDILDFVAPYTGTYYIDPGWDQGSFYTAVSLRVYGHLNLPGTDGNDYLTGSTIDAGLGNDSVVGSGSSTYLRGGDGADVIQGGVGFDDINGNKGDDSIDGGTGGADWLVGGQGNDMITAHATGNILYGNLGNDSLNGGSGDELIRGGKGDDTMSGGRGDDWISGDRGSDTMSGGPGADTFHSSSGAGLDVLTDFSTAEGDKVQLDLGTSYTVGQVGADTVIDMGNGDQLVLKSVNLSTLPTGWLFVT